MYLPQNIRFLRKKMGLAQDDLAAKLGYKSYTTIQKWESGVSEPPFKALVALSELFGCDMDDMANVNLAVESFTKKEAADLITELRTDEHELLGNYNKLNDIGKAKAMSDIRDMTELPKYTKDTSLKNT